MLLPRRDHHHPKLLHNPHHTIVRKVLLYPANGDEPRLIDGIFSEEGANGPFAFFTTALDVHNSYGKYIGRTRWWCFNIDDRLGHSGEPEFVVHFNSDVRLPPIEPLPVLPRTIWYMPDMQR
jgi:hypothetical protein